MARSISVSEVKKHTNAKSIWVIIHNDVYDLTRFLDEHPGGADSLLEVAGQDGTQGFEDVQHSQDARELMKKYKIGSLPANERQNVTPSCCKPKKKRSSCHRLGKVKVKESSSTKSWRSFDRSSGSRSPSKSPSKSPSAHKTSSHHRAPLPPIPMRRVESIVVPKESPKTPRQREQRRSFSPPSSSGGGKLKWAILALAAAIIIGVSLKKYYAV